MRAQKAVASRIKLTGKGAGQLPPKNPRRAGTRENDDIEFIMDETDPPR